MEIVIVGAGIGGLTLALALHKRGLSCRVYEAAPQILHIGVGINLLPHAVKELEVLGLQNVLLAAGNSTEEHLFFTRHGQQVYGEPRGVKAGYEWPQISIHRADLHSLLLKAVTDRLGPSHIVLGRKCTGIDQDERQAQAHFVETTTGAQTESISADVVIACDGIHSAIRKQFFPNEPPPRYSGINMWRGVVDGRPFLSGQTMVHIGWYANGNIVAYPLRQKNLNTGMQLINWVASLETPQHEQRRWDLEGSRDAFIANFEQFVFDWINVPEMIWETKSILEYPMVDQDPLDLWSRGRVTLLGDAAHPMYPRGSNGAGQAILDASHLAAELAKVWNPAEALQAYEAVRRPATTNVVLMNRRNPPDAVLREVYERTGDKPFDDLSRFISDDELQAIASSYKVAAGFDRASLARK